MPRFYNAKRAKRALARLPYSLNALLIVLGAFILLSMAIVWIVFEEFTAFTDYTQQWIEFNFFIHYWDKLTIARVYLSFITIYGAVILAIGAMQIHGMKKANLSFLHLAPLLLIFVAVVTVLGAIVWLIVTAVNYNEGFLANGGFIFERMRFKGNVWKDLIYREQSWKMVTLNLVPAKAPILKIWVHQRERDFSCCGWESYWDYAKGNHTNLPESCCQLRQRVYGCGDNFQTVDLTSVINTRGCRDLMYSWYRAGFAENIIMSIIGLFIGAFQFYLYSLNRREYYKVLDEYDDLRKPMMNTTMSMSTINSRASGQGIAQTGLAHGGTGHVINFGPHPARVLPNPSQRLNQASTPSIGENSSVVGSGGGPFPQINETNFVNPLQNIQNSSGRFPPFTRNGSGSNRPQVMVSTPSDRDLISDSDRIVE